MEVCANKSITTGFNHYFGKNKDGNTDFLEKVCSENNINYSKIPPVKIENTIVSSSVIRKALLCADFKTVKSIAKVLYSIPFLRKIINRYYYLAKKI